jgi:hypothetical protein
VTCARETDARKLANRFPTSVMAAPYRISDVRHLAQQNSIDDAKVGLTLNRISTDRRVDRPAGA